MVNQSDYLLTLIKKPFRVFRFNTSTSRAPLRIGCSISAAGFKFSSATTGHLVRSPRVSSDVFS